MRAKSVFAVLLVLCAFLLLLAPNASAQVNTAAPRITQAISDSRLISLRGNTHPLARAEFDRGAAPADLPMERMVLLLQRSPEQEAALDKFMAEQLDPASPNFHHWLSPEQFGALYGPSDQDIETVKAWLASHGFTVNSVSKGRTTIEFSGTAAQAQGAFHTAIHKFVLPNGEEHWANVNDPAIPAALAPVVSGIRSLHNFTPKAMSHIRGQASMTSSASEGKPHAMFFAAGGPCSALQTSPFNLAPAGTACFMVTPGDLAVIYNIASPAGDGTGQTIAIVNDSNINIQDVRAFRSLMGLPAKDPVVILASGTDPGIQPKGDETEAVLDVEWAGSVAPNANVDLVIAPTTTTTFGGDTAATFIVDNNLSPILNESFGGCELSLGTSGNTFYNNLWQQAAAEGITVFVSSGDTGSAGCDTGTAAASLGLAVNGLASTPFNVAVGGTDFDDVTNPATFWNTGTGSPAQTSALGYIPEVAWNDSCTNPVFHTVLSGFGTSAVAVCNNSQVVAFSEKVNNPSLLLPFGGSGGVSACTTPSGSTPSTCSGGYPKPAWQTGTGVPSDNKRDLPDVSLFAGTGTISASFYYLCQSDQAPCNFNSGTTIFGGGGTSVSTQVFGGLMALVLQNANGVRQGNANTVFYALAAQQPAANCSSSRPPLSTCIFNDITDGTNTTPCATSSPNCSVSVGGLVHPLNELRPWNALRLAPAVLGALLVLILLLNLRGRARRWGVAFTAVAIVAVIAAIGCGGGGSSGSGVGGGTTDSVGVLAANGMLAYTAGVGYDLATGLGSINVANLAGATLPGNASGWATTSDAKDFALISNGQVSGGGNSGTLAVTISPQNGFSGSVTLSCVAMPTGDTCSAFSPAAPVSVTASTPITVTVTGTGGLIAGTGIFVATSGTVTHSIGFTIP